MDLEKVTAKIRPRKSWEAIDLGMLLVQKHWKKLYAIWFIVTLPFFLLFLPLYFVYEDFPIILLWLLKPLLERPLLYFISRELFSEKLSVKDCVKSFFHLASKQWLLSITWRRLSFTRSFDLPVILLEGLSGKNRSERIRVIHSNGVSQASWLTIVFYNIESFLLPFGVLGLIVLFIPQHMLENVNIFSWYFYNGYQFWVSSAIYFLSYLCMSIVAPFYVLCGFSLYINQRTILEAWDIELTFRRLAKRLQEKYTQSARLVSSLVAIGILFALAIFPEKSLMAQENTQFAVYQTEKSIESVEPSAHKQEPSAHKQEPSADKEPSANKQEPSAHEDPSAKKKQPSASEEKPSTHKQTKQQIKEILKGKDFHQKTTRYQYKHKDHKEDVQEIKKASNSFWMNLLIPFFAGFMEFALWVFVALLLVFLLVKYGHFSSSFQRLQKTKKSRPKTLFGLDIQQDSLPEKPWSVALDLIQQGEYREALSLLYRTSLIWYMENTPVKISEGDTELQCLKKLLKYSDAPKKQLMQQLTQAWRNLAYAHQMPDKMLLQKLCQTWSQLLASNQTEQSAER